MKYLNLILMLICHQLIFAQSDITISDIWTEYKYYPQYVPGFNFMNDGRHYTQRSGDYIIQLDIESGEVTDTIFDPSDILSSDNFPGKFDSYSFSADERMILFSTSTERIYRHSTKADYYLYDLDRRHMDKLFDGDKQMYPSIGPYNQHVAFIVDNNLFIKSLVSGEVKQITHDGQQNSIINGAADWVYEEEFGLTRAYEWNVDGSRLAYLRFDESQVPMFMMKTYHNDIYPDYETFKYPKVGEKNSVVTLFAYKIGEDKARQIDLPQEYEYLPRIQWTKDVDKLTAQTLNRHQNELNLWLLDLKNLRSNILLTEQSEGYVDVHDFTTFLEDEQHFTWASERNGFLHLYLYSLKGKLIRPLTVGSMDVTNFYGVDWLHNQFYYQASSLNPAQKNVYRGSLDGGVAENISTEQGWNTASFSPTYDYYLAQYSNINTPPSFEIKNRSDEVIRVLVDNEKLRQLQQEVGVNNIEFMEVLVPDAPKLPAYIIKPDDFDQRRQYPLLMYLYNGPNSQEVTDQWKGQNYWWFQMLADEGFIIACVDGRGTGSRGRDYRQQTYMKLGELESHDQIGAAKYFATLPYIDKEHIGIFGWSYGGYMSSLCLLKGADVFKAAISVAPVTNWKWYDNVYTERFMRTYEENPEGYDNNSPMMLAHKLKGDLLLIHGGSDDNVHVQHTMEFANALIQANKQFDMYIYPNDNHSIASGNARRHLYEKMTSFLIEKLKP